MTEQKTGVKVKVGDEEVKADYLAIAGGRAPDIEALGLDAAGREDRGERRQIEIDEYQQTSAEGVYAIGDLVRGPALAHKASEEGVVAVEHAGGAETHPVDMDLIAGATFCHPQVASVGHDRGAGEGGRQADQGRQVQARRRRRLGRLRRPRRAWSRSSATPSTARSSAPTSSATSPAT